MTNLRILTLKYVDELSHLVLFNGNILIDLIDDKSLCNILTSNGLRQLNLVTDSDQSNLINLGQFILERLPYLEVIEIHGCRQQIELIEMAFILINGLSKLSFIALSGFKEICLIYEKRITLFNSNTRHCRMEMITQCYYGNTLLIWL